MEAARCDLCGKPVSSWLEVCDKLNVCLDCAASVTLAGLAGAGYARIQPETFQMDGETLVTNVSPDVILDYQKAKEQLSTAYGMRADNGNKTPELVQVEVKPLSPEAERNFIGSILKSGDIPDEPMGHADIAYTLKQSYSWTIEEIVKYIKDLGFATEKAFYTHCATLMEGGYTEETSYALILHNRYNEQTVCDEIGTHYNALEGQTEEEAIKLFIKSEEEFEKEHPEYA